MIELAAREALEVRHLAAGHIDDLDIFPGAHGIGFGRSGIDADILERIAQRFGERNSVLAAGHMRPFHPHFDRRRRVLHLRIHFAAGRANDEDTVALRREALPIAGRRCGAEQPDRLGLAEIDPAPREGIADVRCGFAVASERRPEAAGLVCCPDIQHRRIAFTVATGRCDLARLPAFEVGDRQAVARFDLQSK